MQTLAEQMRGDYPNPLKLCRQIAVAIWHIWLLRLLLLWSAWTCVVAAASIAIAKQFHLSKRWILVALPVGVCFPIVAHVVRVYRRWLEGRRAFKDRPVLSDDGFARGCGAAPAVQPIVGRLRHLAGKVAGLPYDRFRPNDPVVELWELAKMPGFPVDLVTEASFDFDISFSDDILKSLRAFKTFADLLNGIIATIPPDRLAGIAANASKET